MRSRAEALARVSISANAVPTVTPPRREVLVQRVLRCLQVAGWLAEFDEANRRSG